MKAADYKFPEPSKFCKKHGFQKSPGFKVDKVIGVMQVPIILCHNDKQPEPKERVVMPTADGKVRVHDYVGISRSQGHQVIHDKWSLVKAKGKKLLELLRVIVLKMIGKKEKAFISVVEKL